MPPAFPDGEGEGVDVELTAYDLRNAVLVRNEAEQRLLTASEDEIDEAAQAYYDAVAGPSSVSAHLKGEAVRPEQ